MSAFCRGHFASARIRTRVLLLLHLCPRQTRKSDASSCTACGQLCRRCHRLSADDREQEMCHSIQCVAFLRFSLEKIDICKLVAYMLARCHSSLLRIAVKISAALLSWSQRWGVPGVLVCDVALVTSGAPRQALRGVRRVQSWLVTRANVVDRIGTIPYLYPTLSNPCRSSTASHWCVQVSCRLGAISVVFRSPA